MHARLQRAPGGMWVQDTTAETRRQLVASLPQVRSPLARLASLERLQHRLVALLLRVGVWFRC